MERGPRRRRRWRAGPPGVEAAGAARPAAGWARWREKSSLGKPCLSSRVRISPGTRGPGQRSRQVAELAPGRQSVRASPGRGPPPPRVPCARRTRLPAARGWGRARLGPESRALLAAPRSDLLSGGVLGGAGHGSRLSPGACPLRARRFPAGKVARRGDSSLGPRRTPGPLCQHLSVPSRGRGSRTRGRSHHFTLSQVRVSPEEVLEALGSCFSLFFCVFPPFYYRILLFSEGFAWEYSTYPPILSKVVSEF